jgi:hypothetical protein
VNLIWLRNCVRMWYVTKVRSINRRAKQKIKGSVIVTANISLDTKGEMTNYGRNVIDVDWGLVVKLALPAKVTRRANKVVGIYDRSH